MFHLIWTYLHYLLGRLLVYINSIPLRLQGITRKRTILLVGLDNAGKTTLLHYFRTKISRSRSPGRLEVGINEIDCNRTRFTILDTGGMAAPPLSNYLPLAGGIVFLVDAADPDRFPETKRMLDDLLVNEEVRGKPNIILGNKIDSPLAVGPDEFFRALGLDGRGGGWGGQESYEQRAFKVVLGSVVLGQGGSFHSLPLIEFVFWLLLANFGEEFWLT
ncbi:ADP-ribosylation factor family-domain-containing protein [Aspergillus crustosus]